MTHPAHAVAVTLYDGPCDGLTVRLSPWASTLELPDGAGGIARYVRRDGDRWTYAPLEASR
jgi:hypothetical protein